MATEGRTQSVALYEKELVASRSRMVGDGKGTDEKNIRKPQISESEREENTLASQCGKKCGAEIMGNVRTVGARKIYNLTTSFRYRKAAPQPPRTFRCFAKHAI